MSEYHDEQFHLPLVPGLAPLFGTDKLIEMDEDYEYLKYMYPKITRDILTLIDEECDKMEYDGSLMFDETPDRLMLHQIMDRIYDAVSGKNMDTNIRDFEMEQYEENMQAEELPLEGTLVTDRRPGMRPPRPPHLSLIHI